MFGSRVSVQAGDDASSKFRIEGWIEDGDDFSADSKFHKASCTITIYSEPNFERFTEFSKEQGVDHACGVLNHTKDLEPKTFEYLGETKADPPIKVNIYLDKDSFNSFYLSVSEAFRKGSKVGGTIRISGKDLPEIESIWSWIQKSELDISKKQRYAVTNFDIGQII